MRRWFFSTNDKRVPVPNVKFWLVRPILQLRTFLRRILVKSFEKLLIQSWGNCHKIQERICTLLLYVQGWLLLQQLYCFRDTVRKTPFQSLHIIILQLRYIIWRKPVFFMLGTIVVFINCLGDVSPQVPPIQSILNRNCEALSNSPTLGLLRVSTNLRFLNIYMDCGYLKIWSKISWYRFFYWLLKIVVSS